MGELVKLKDIRVLSHKKFLLRNISFDLKKNDGTWQAQQREVYDHGNAVTVLLYNKQRQTVLLVRQFRIVAFMDDAENGMLLETCAGLLEGMPPHEVVVREIEEETGYHVTGVQQVYEAFTSAGSLSEKLYFFVAEYKDEQKRSAGGGLAGEQEEIEVVEMPFTEAVALMNTGKLKDVKTILLLQYAIIHQLLA